MSRLSTGLCLALLLAAASGCGGDGDGSDTDGDSVGSLQGAFTCQITEDGALDFDLGTADFEGDLEHTGYIAGLRTQGCYARTLEAERGWVVSVRMFQQISFDVAQVLELNLPIEAAGDADRLLEAGDSVAVSGNAGFGSMYWIEAGGVEPAPLFLRTVGGDVLIDEPADLGSGEWFSGHFDALQMGAL